MLSGSAGQQIFDLVFFFVFAIFRFVLVALIEGNWGKGMSKTI